MFFNACAASFARSAASPSVKGKFAMPAAVPKSFGLTAVVTISSRDEAAAPAFTLPLVGGWRIFYNQ